MLLLVADEQEVDIAFLALCNFPDLHAQPSVLRDHNILATFLAPVQPFVRE